MPGLFGEEFEINLDKPQIKDILKKANTTEASTIDDKKLMKSKQVTLLEKLAFINERVLSVLGRQKQNIEVVRDINRFSNYIDKAIETGYIAVDTETNNSTDAFTCKLMGLCLYVPGEKQIYIPVNHVNPETNVILPNQLTENDIKEQLSRLITSPNKLEIIMHNGKFDYEVLKCTCGLILPPTWDTLVGARLIDENKYSDKRVSLKYIYVTEIDPVQSKYSIDGLFENIPYRYVDPDIFALYAATDSLMTYKVYLWEMKYFDQIGNKVQEQLAREIEMPIVQVTAETELRGVCIDQKLGKALKEKYNSDLEELDKKIQVELDNLAPYIKEWRLTDKATAPSIQYPSANTKMAQAKIEAMYPHIEQKTGRRFKYGNPLTNQLEDPINLASPTQLGILLYDVLGAPVINKSKPKATGEEDLGEIMKALQSDVDRAEEEHDFEALGEAKTKLANFSICDLILKRRGLVKIITTYIDVIPALAQHWPDGRIRYRLNSTGTDTGRFASGGKFRFLDENDNPVELNSINSQNIPSHNPEIRLLFQAGISDTDCECVNSTYRMFKTTEVETSRGWIEAQYIKVGDTFITTEGCDIVKAIKQDENYYIFSV